jgi:hypothetical protein
VNRIQRFIGGYTKNGDFVVSISKQKAGTFINVFAQDASSNQLDKIIKGVQVLIS